MENEIYPRHILVDTLGFIKKALVLPASISDKAGGKQLLEKASDKFIRLKHLWADFAYTGLIGWLMYTYAITLEIVKSPQPLKTIKKSKAILKKDLLQLYLLSFTNENKTIEETKKGFQVVPWRWIVERTFACICRNRRLNKDYEHSCSSSEAFIYLAMMTLMLKRLTKPG